MSTKSVTVSLPALLGSCDSGGRVQINRAWQAESDVLGMGFNTDAPQQDMHWGSGDGEGVGENLGRMSHI